MIDNTIVNSIKVLVDLYNEDFQYYDDFKKISWVDVDTYDLQECSCATKEQLLEYFNQHRFFLYLEYNDWAKEVLNELKEYFDIYIVTLGTPANLRGKERWRKINMPYATLIGVDINKYKDKSHLDLSDGVFIDDVPEYLETSNAKDKICFGDVYSWNKDWQGIRCYNWHDVKRYLLSKLIMDDFEKAKYGIFESNEHHGWDFTGTVKRPWIED